MAFGLAGERDIERWLQPYTAAVTFANEPKRMSKNTRLFFMLYRHLIAFGVDEETIAAYAQSIEVHEKLHRDFAMTKAVFNLAKDWNVELPRDFFRAGEE